MSDKVRVYGESDDLIEIENDKNFDEVGCYNNTATIWFSDNTVIAVKYGKEGKGIWEIKEIEGGHASRKLTPCYDEDADVYSDIFEIEAEVVDVCVGEVDSRVRELVAKFREISRNYSSKEIERAMEEVFG